VDAEHRLSAKTKAARYNGGMLNGEEIGW
jgi:hypothetical protein